MNPYLAEETIVDLIEESLLDKDFHTAVADYTAAVLHGVVKIASKMGISTLQSYQSAQIFEAVGIRQDVLSTSTLPTPSHGWGASAWRRWPPQWSGTTTAPSTRWDRRLT